LADAHECPRNGTKMLLSRSDDWIFSRWVLPHRPAEDLGLHTVCVKVTSEFLDFSVLDGNDLVTPHPEWGFPGLKPGDKWCVCVTRWKAALDHNRAAPVDLEATHSSALEFVTLEDLKAHALK